MHPVISGILSFLDSICITFLAKTKINLKVGSATSCSSLFETSMLMDRSYIFIDFVEPIRDLVTFKNEWAEIETLSIPPAPSSVPSFLLEELPDPNDVVSTSVLWSGTILVWFCNGIVRFIVTIFVILSSHVQTNSFGSRYQQ